MKYLPRFDVLFVVHLSEDLDFYALNYKEDISQVCAWVIGLADILDAMLGQRGNRGCRHVLVYILNFKLIHI
jgi:hypothetical protein